MKISSTLYYPSATLRTRLYDLPPHSKVEWFKFYFSQFGTGASLKAQFYKEYDAGVVDWLNKTLTNSALGAATSERGFFHAFPFSIEDVNAFSMFFTFN